MACKEIRVEIFRNIVEHGAFAARHSHNVMTVYDGVVVVRQNILCVVVKEDRAYGQRLTGVGVVKIIVVIRAAHHGVVDSGALGVYPAVNIGVFRLKRRKARLHCRKLFGIFAVLTVAVGAFALRDAVIQREHGVVAAYHRKSGRVVEGFRAFGVEIGALKLCVIVYLGAVYLAFYVLCQHDNADCGDRGENDQKRYLQNVCKSAPPPLILFFPAVGAPRGRAVRAVFI